MSTERHLRNLMALYTVDHLRPGLSTDTFLDSLTKFLQLDDYRMEGFASPDAQRDLTVRFQWGHNHNFGPMEIKGLMGDRHIELIGQFVDCGALPLDLTDKIVLDVGCWTGGTSLLLHAMGAAVDAVDEVTKYTQCLVYLSDSFNIDRLCVENESLYYMGAHSMNYVVCFGVLYHVTDPITTLRKLFDTLVDGGTLLLETAINGQRDATFSYCGPRHATGTRPYRQGWNWLIPSKLALQHMLEDVGFEDIKLIPWKSGRMTVVAKRNWYKDMLRSGLSMEVQ